jgi:hypothetical protein
MKKTDLRVNNWVQAKGDKTWYQISSGKDIDDVCSYVWYEPIPLTSKILEMFGFKFERGMFYIAHKMHIEDYDGLGTFYFAQTQTRIKYLHQLQNLYEAATGEELTIKEPEVERSVATVMIY